MRSFRVEGGQAVIRMTDGRGQAGHRDAERRLSRWQTVQNAPDNLAVYFNETNHSFIIHAVWFNDRPFVEVSEIGG